MPYISEADEVFIRQTVMSFMANHGVPGVSIALTDHGRLVFARGYGLADPASGEAVGTGHLFRIASLSKPITATTVFKLIEANQLHLSDRVFGDNGMLGKRFGTQPHMARTSTRSPSSIFWNTPVAGRRHKTRCSRSSNLSQAELIEWMIDHVPLAHAPGTISEYLNFGYLVLGRVIEEVTGLSYENAVGQHVLGPCGIVDMHIAIHGDEMHELVQLPEDKDDGT
jgi:CubicO group peptidase (beta-lactamase class C family)